MSLIQRVLYERFHCIGFPLHCPLLCYTLLSCGLSCDCSVSAHDTAVLASPVTTSLIPVSFAVDGEPLKYLSRCYSGLFLTCKSLNSTGVVSSTWTLRGQGNKFARLNKCELILYNLVVTCIPYSGKFWRGI